MLKFGGPGKKKKRCIQRACKGVQEDTQTTTTSLSGINASCSKGASTSLNHTMNVDALARYTTEEIIKVCSICM